MGMGMGMRATVALGAKAAQFFDVVHSRRMFLCCAIVGRPINDSIRMAARGWVDAAQDGCSHLHGLLRFDSHKCMACMHACMRVRSGSAHGELSDAPWHGEIGPVLETQRCGWYMLYANMLCRWAVAYRQLQLWKSMHV